MKHKWYILSITAGGMHRTLSALYEAQMIYSLNYRESQAENTQCTVRSTNDMFPQLPREACREHTKKSCLQTFRSVWTVTQNMALFNVSFWHHALFRASCKLPLSCFLLYQANIIPANFILGSQYLSSWWITLVFLNQNFGSGISILANCAPTHL